MECDCSSGVLSFCNDNELTCLFGSVCGSRASGLHSEGSDYDIRLIVSKPLLSYLSIHETKTDSWTLDASDQNPLDIQAWDVRKACSLILNSNYRALEMLCSDVVAHSDDLFLEELKVVCMKSFSRKKLLFHLLNDMRYHHNRFLKEKKEEIDGKKLLFVVKALMTFLFVKNCEKECQESLFPVNFDDLFEKSKTFVPQHIHNDILQLAKDKKDGNLKEKTMKPLLEISKWYIPFIEHNSDAEKDIKEYPEPSLEDTKAWIRMYDELIMRTLLRLHQAL